MSPEITVLNVEVMSGFFKHKLRLAMMLQTPEGAVIPTPSNWITNALCSAAKEKATKDNKSSFLWHRGVS